MPERPALFASPPPVPRPPRDAGSAAGFTGAGRTGWLGAVIALAVLLAYANSFPGAFFFDDDAAIAQNTSIRDLGNLRQVLWPPVEAGIGGRPFANLTYAINYAFGGYDVAGYHAGNLAIHLAAALVLFGLIRRTLLQPRLRGRFGRDATWFGATAAALWALHPLQTNVTDYMSQRTEGLMGMLYLLTLYAFVRGVERPSRTWNAVAVVACALGMATKEGMVTAPAIVLLYDRTFVSGSFAAALRRHRRTHLALAATWVLLAALMLTSKLSERGVGFDLGQSAHDYALTECRAVVRYLQRSFWPHPLVFDYGPNYLHTLAAAAPGALVLLAALAATAYAWWAFPAAGFAAAWFFILLSPSSSVIPVVQQPCAENRVYLPLVGAVVLLAGLGYRALGRRALPGLALAAAALGIATHARNPAFRSELAVWWDTLARQPDNARAANNLGNALLKAGRHDEAAPYFEAAIRLSPGYADAHNNRGVTLLRQGRPGEALKEFEVATRTKANYADAHYNLGEAYLQLGRPADAIAALRTAIQLAPANAKAHNNLGIALLDTGHVAESIAAERRAIALNPGLPEAHYNLGNSLARAGDKVAALAAYDQALRLDPRFARALNNAGVLLLQTGRHDEAAARFEAALRIDPNYAEARQNLALVRPPPPAP